MWDGRNYRKEVHRTQGFMEIPNNMTDGAAWVLRKANPCLCPLTPCERKKKAGLVLGPC